MTPRAAETDNRWHPWAAIAGWILPGLGHVLIGQASRGIILGVTILSLWVGGFLVGGISVFDHRQHPAWFLGQVMVGPSLIANRIFHGSLQAGRDFTPSPEGPYAFEPGFGRVNEQGILYTALAGLLNLLVILDVLYRSPQEPAARSAANARRTGDAAT